MHILVDKPGRLSEKVSQSLAVMILERAIELRSSKSGEWRSLEAAIYASSPAIKLAEDALSKGGTLEKAIEILLNEEAGK